VRSFFVHTRLNLLLKTFVKHINNICLIDLEQTMHKQFCEYYSKNAGKDASKNASKNAGKILLRAGFGAMMVIVLAVVGVHVYMHSNWSAKERMTVGISAWNENIETSLEHVNTRQAILMSAAHTCGIDARALGASIMARRLLEVQPVRQKWNEIFGTAVNIGVAHISVQSTEAAFRVVFAPTQEDSLLYYPSPTHSVNDGVYQDVYANIRLTLAPYRMLTSEQMQEALQHNEYFNIHAAGLIMKQAIVRSVKEREYAERQGQILIQTPQTQPQLAFLTQEREDVAQIAALLYQRGDMLP
jgi:hypothetical protein